jgi:iron complex outermembrane recepter protein
MRVLPSAVLLVCSVAVAAAQHLGAPTDDLDKLSVEELFTLQVTSVGREAQQLSKAPAAVFVLTAEDIRRSGATCIPEALRWVPGLTVLRVDGRSWVVSARGSARLYANKMLVMIDGRSLYTPLFSGVIWDAINVPLQEIERIEVVRGPGAVMWGPNAVDGVINIITKRARAALGGQATAAAGNELIAGAEAGWAAAPNDKVAYRTWGRKEYRNPADSSLGSYLLDDIFPWQGPSVTNLSEASGGLGFRVDGQPDDRDQWTVQGDIYKTGRHDPLAFPIVMPDDVPQQSDRTNYSGGSLGGEWTRSPAGTESTLRFAFARDNLAYPFLASGTDNLNLDFQQRTHAGEGNELYWGLGFQQYSDSTSSSQYLAMFPAAFRYRAADVVLRDEWQFVPGRLLGSAGIRLDYNSYHRVEYQPSLRLLYTPSARQSAWLAVSRAVRLPNRFDRDMLLNGGAVMVDGMPVEITSYPVPTLLSEVERSAEAGYRIQSGQHWSLDLSLFWSYYTSLVAENSPSTLVNLGTDDAPILQLPLFPDNSGTGRTYGAEVSGVWQAARGWRLIPGYSYLNESWWLPASGDLTYEWDRPRSNLHHQGTLRSQFDLSRHWRLDIMARARSRDTTFALPGTFLVDARLAWLPTKSGEFSLAVQDLTARHVLETYSEGPFVAIPTERTFVLRWSQRF